MSALSTTSQRQERKLVGFEAFKLNRSNPMSDKFEIRHFHSLEFWCGDATNTSRRFQWGLGMSLVCKSDLSTGNKDYASYVIKSNKTVFAFTAPYHTTTAEVTTGAPHPNFSQAEAHRFVMIHGLAVRAVGILVTNAADAYAHCVAHGAKGVLAPTTLQDASQPGASMCISEIAYFGDTVIRWISTSGNFQGSFLPNYVPVESPDLNFGIDRLDHAVSNVPNLFEAVDYLMTATGMHEYSEFTAADVGTVDSGLNSMVVTNNNEMVLLPVNEPTFGTKRKSQIQTYLEHNNGAGVQHLALKTDNIFVTVREMRKRSLIGGFEFMPAPSQAYYAKVPERIGADTLTPSQLSELQELGLLADRDDQGVLLQVFTKPLGDRPTIFIEIIQRIGCDTTPEGEKKEQSAGCGGFGKGNFSELFKSIENYEKSLE